MTRRFWQQDEIDLLHRMVADGDGYSALSSALGRSHGAINAKLKVLGLRIDPDAAARRRIEKNKARTGEKRGYRPCTPEQRERLRSYCVKMNSDPAIRAEAIERMRQWKRSPEGREKSRQAREKQLAAKFGHLSAESRETYRFLTKQKGLRSHEALAIIEADIERAQAAAHKKAVHEMRERAEAMKRGGGRARITQPLIEREKSSCR